MGLAHSPRIVTDNLVFYYDMGNIQKSWRGRPASNLVSVSNSNNAPAARSSGTTVSTNQIAMPKEVLKYSGTKIFADVSSNTSSFWVAYTSGPSVTQGEQYTISWYVYPINITSVVFNWGGAHQGTSSSFTVNLSNGEVSNLSIISGETYSVSKEDGGWWRLACTTTMSNGTNCYPQLNCGAGSVAICGVQFESGNILSRYLIGTRSNTQAILDLIGNTTVTATSLTYNSDGTFGFNGTDNSISLGNTTITQFPHDSAWSIQMLVNIKSFTNTFPGILIKGSSAGSGVLLFFGSGGGLLWKHNNSQGTVVNFTFNQPFMLTVTHNGSGSIKVYKNDLYSAAGVSMVSTETSSGLLLGRGDQFGNSDIYAFFKYSKELSAQEVAQNFQALRGRYGL
jgi:hypothetical protein